MDSVHMPTPTVPVITSRFMWAVHSLCRPVLVAAENTLHSASVTRKASKLLLLLLFFELVKDVGILRLRISLVAMSFQKISTGNLTRRYKEKETEATSCVHLVQIQEKTS